MSQKSRKIRAIVAGGAVLGVGAAITLAAWSDSEFADGLFNTSAFGIEAAADGGQFADNPDSDNMLRLEFEGQDALAPGDVVSIDYQIKNIEEGADSRVTFFDQTITGADGAEGIGDTLSASVLDGTCEAPGPALTAGESGFDLTGQTVKDLCVQVSLSDSHSDVNSAQSAIVWQFDAAQLEETVAG